MYLITNNIFLIFTFVCKKSTLDEMHNKIQDIVSSVL